MAPRPHASSQREDQRGGNRQGQRVDGAEAVVAHVEPQPVSHQRPQARAEERRQAVVRRVPGDGGGLGRARRVRRPALERHQRGRQAQQPPHLQEQAGKSREIGAGHGGGCREWRCIAKNVQKRRDRPAMAFQHGPQDGGQEAHAGNGAEQHRGAEFSLHQPFQQQGHHARQKVIGNKQQKNRDQSQPEGRGAGDVKPHHQPQLERQNQKPEGVEYADEVPATRRSWALSG